MLRLPPSPTLFPSTTLFRSHRATSLSDRSHPLRGYPELLRERRYRGRALRCARDNGSPVRLAEQQIDSRKPGGVRREIDRKSTRLNSSHVAISYAVFCLRKT